MKILNKLIFNTKSKYSFLKQQVYFNLTKQTKQNQSNHSNHSTQNEKETFSTFENQQKNEEFEKQSTINSGRSIFYVFATSSIVVTCIYIGLKFMKSNDKVENIQRSGKVTYVGKAKIGGDWELTNCKTNQPFGSNDLKGKYYMIYFGFTRCPDVCPMSMTKIGSVLKQIRTKKESKFYDIEAVFVSLDPDRDSNERAVKYASLFDPSFITVTAKSNNDETLKKMLKDFKIHSSKIMLKDEEDENDTKTFKRNASFVYDTMSNYENDTNDTKEMKNNEKYSLDHTIVTYLIGTNNEFLTYLSGNLTSEEMTSIVYEEIMRDLNEKVKVNKK